VVVLSVAGEWAGARPINTAGARLPGLAVAKRTSGDKPRHAGRVLPIAGRRTNAVSSALCRRVARPYTVHRQLFGLTRSRSVVGKSGSQRTGAT
jgi:hypothetical protein